MQNSGTISPFRRKVKGKRRGGQKKGDDTGRRAKTTRRGTEEPASIVNGDEWVKKL